MGRGGRGRPSKPTALKLVDGTRKDRINKAEPKPAEVSIEPPPWLVDELALEAWGNLAPDLIDRGVLTGWDVQAFAEWCSAVAHLVRAEQALAIEGHVIEAEVFDRNGKPTGTRLIRSEWSRVWKDALEVTARRAAKFGLTPSDRAGISVDGADAGEGKDPSRLLS